MSGILPGNLSHVSLHYRAPGWPETVDYTVLHSEALLEAPVANPGVGGEGGQV